MAIGCGVLLTLPVVAVVAFLVWFDIAVDKSDEWPEKTKRESRRELTEVTRDFHRHARLKPVDSASFSSDDCYKNGGVSNETVDSAYRLSHGWEVASVPEREAVRALRDLREHLEEEGWEIITFGQDSIERELRAQKDGDHIHRATFLWHREERTFSGSAGAACAIDPEWRGGDPEDRPGRSEPY